MKLISTVLAASTLMLGSLAFADEGAWSMIEGNWAALQPQVMEQWGALTEDDLAQINGSREALISALQEKYGIGEDEAAAQVEDWVATLGG